MYLLYADESNLDPTGTEFFVYGGVAVPSQSAAELSTEIERIRTDAGVPRDFLLKFNPRPENMDHEGFRSLKQTVIEAAANCGCVFFSNLILHRIAQDQQEARRTGINTIVYHFDTYLRSVSDHGLVLIDRFQDDQIDTQLRRRFSTGVTGLPFSEEHRLERILGFHYSAIGQSHFTSVVDIIIGAFRYAVNSFSNQRNLTSARSILQVVSPLFLRSKSGDRVRAISLHFSPVVVTAPPLRTRYEELQSFFLECGIEMAQTVSAQRQW